LLNRKRAFNPAFRPGNTPQVANLEFINGYSPMRPAGMHTALGFWLVHGATEPHSASRLLRRDLGRGALLDHLRINAVAVPIESARQYGVVPGNWRARRIGNDLILERDALPGKDAYLQNSALLAANDEAAGELITTLTAPAFPPVLTNARAHTVEAPGTLRAAAFCSDAILTNVTRTRHSTEAEIDTRGCATDALVIFPRAWYPGFEGRIGAATVPLLKADVIMPALRVPPRTHSRIAVEYRPLAKRIAPYSLALAFAMLAALCWKSRVSAEAPA
jgi:hypothetical protein